MIPKLTVLCFAPSYAVTLLLEITRLFFRSGIRGALMLGFAGLGLVLHTLFLGQALDGRGCADAAVQ